jgi:hypothetical protein
MRNLDMIAVNFVREEGGFTPVPVTDLVMSVLSPTSVFTPLPDYDVKQQVNFKMAGECGAYLAQDERIGCVIVQNETQDWIPVIIFADFINEKEIIVEANPDGFGGRTQIQKLSDPRLLGLKKFLTPVNNI